jgi:crotonobetainyl-CoA:carnitine CoA-transferase CaiB-like acyl-CoA transferase
LASLGATVTRVEPAIDPWADAEPNPVRAALFEYLHDGKLSSSGFEQTPLASQAVWLDSRSAREILDDPLTIGHRDNGLNPHLSHVTFTPFGLDGPWRDMRGSALVAAAAGGFLYICGDPEREPLRNGGHLPDFQMGLIGAMAAVAGLLATEFGQPGRLIDISLLEAVVAFHERGDLAVTHIGADLVRSRRHEGTHPFMVLPCKDGFCTLAVGTPRQWQNLCILIDRPEWADDPEFLVNRLAHWEEIDTALLPWLAQHTGAEVTQICQELLIASGPVLTASQVLADAHLIERDFFRQVRLPMRALTVPGFPVRHKGRGLDRISAAREVE